MEKKENRTNFFYECWGFFIKVIRMTIKKEENGSIIYFRFLRGAGGMGICLITDYLWGNFLAILFGFRLKITCEGGVGSN